MVIVLSPKFYNFGEELYSVIKARVNIVPNRTAKTFASMAQSYRKILLDVIVPHYIQTEVLFCTKTRVLFV